jgi:Ran GTPase-activating protein (RanGAP) involved in mRNA processing and transport
MLWLVNNQITSQGISSLASTLHSNTTLEGLSLCANGITDVHVLYITLALSDSNSKLNRLALTSNDITDEGAQHLADMLKTNQSLTQLWLGFNKITDQGVEILTNALAHQNQTLHVLSLSWNKLVTDLSVDFVINMLEYNQTLRTVCLANCNLSDTSKVKLRQATKSYKEFYLDL